MKGYQHHWLASGYDMEIGHFLEVTSMVVTWCIVAFLHSVRTKIKGGHTLLYSCLESHLRVRAAEPENGADRLHITNLCSRVDKSSTKG